MNSNIFIIARIIIICFVVAAVTAVSRAQTPCDSCLTIGKLVDKWHLTGLPIADLQLRNRANNIVAGHVRRVARETIYQNDIPRQGLHVWYEERYSCRDTIVPLDGAYKLVRGTEAGSPDSTSIPILPAREYACEDLLSPSGMFIGFGATVVSASRDGMATQSRVDAVIGGGRAIVGFPVGTKIELGIGADVLGDDFQVRVPVFAHARWSPFGGPHSESALHYLPRRCQFFGPGDSAMRPPDMRCMRADAWGERDSSVYVAEERQIVPSRFVPFLYCEAGIILNGGDPVAVRWEWVRSDESHGQSLFGIGVGAPLFGPFVVTVGYRYMNENINSMVVMIGAEFR